MRIFNEIGEIKKIQLHRSVITIGNFDGLHRGHQELIKHVCELSLSLKRPSVLITYFPHPLTVLNSKKDISLLLNFKDWVLELEKFGLDNLVIEKFTLALSEREPETYLKENILKPLNPSVIVVGENFKFGNKRKGTTLLLRGLEKKYQYRFQEFPLFKLNWQIVSSTRVRDYLGDGNLEKASYLLGRPYFLRGKIIPGEKRGRNLGYPTLNLEVRDQFIPPYGVYVSSISIGSKEKLKSVTNIGCNPTFTKDALGILSKKVSSEIFSAALSKKKKEKEEKEEKRSEESQGEEKVKIETHIFDERKVDFDILNLDDKVYGLEVVVVFYRFLRSERKFETKENLQEQIKRDIHEARAFKRDSRIW